MVKLKNKYFYFNCIFTSCLILFPFFNSCEKEISSTQVVEVFPTGNIVIESYPSSSKIFIDSKNSGYITPATVSLLELCEHNISLRNDLWKNYEFTIVPEEDKTVEYFADFRTLNGVEGSVKIRSNAPKTRVEILGESGNLITPALKTGLLPGHYIAEGKKEQHRPDFKAFTIKSGDTCLVDLVLEDTTHWVSYTTENSDIQQKIINDIKVDNYGIKWLATNNGLIKYFNNIFALYTKENSGLPNNSINCLLVDSQNILWIGTPLGLVKFDGENWTTYNISNSGISSDMIMCIDEGPGNQIWIGTQDNGICSYDGSNWTQFNTSNSSLKTNFITAIAVNSKGNVLLGTAGIGISFFANGKWIHITNAEDPILPGSSISAIEVDQNDVFWIGHLPSISKGEPGGLSRFDGANLSNVNIVGYQANISNIFADRFGYKWISTKDGIIRFDENNIPTHLREMHYNVISGVAMEKEGLYWVSTLGKGIAKYKF